MVIFFLFLKVTAQIGTSSHTDQEDSYYRAPKIVFYRNGKKWAPSS